MSPDHPYLLASAHLDATWSTNQNRYTIHNNQGSGGSSPRGFLGEHPSHFGPFLSANLDSGDTDFSSVLLYPYDLVEPRQEPILRRKTPAHPIAPHAVARRSQYMDIRFPFLRLTLESNAL